MKARLSVLILVTILLLAAPMAVAKQHEPVGDAISIYTGTPTTFPAEEPFHIEHGWRHSLSEQHTLGLWSFELEVDGVLQEADYIATEYRAEDKTLLRGWTYNFPEGMTDTHEFTGRWLAPCQAAVDSGIWEGDCPVRNEIVVVHQLTLEVQFTE